jgi:hypothetical protein
MPQPSGPPTVLTTRDAVALFGEGPVRWNIASGRWQRPAKGVVVAHSGPLSPDEHLTCELLVQAPGAALAGLTAAHLDGLKNFATDQTDQTFVTIAASSTPRERPNVVVKRSRSFTEADVHPARTPRRTRIARSVIDAASWMKHDLRAQAVIAASVQQKLVTPQALQAEVDRHLTLPKRALIVETLRDVAGGSLSEYETLFMRMCRRFRLPIPTRQRKRQDSSGKWRYLDADFDDFNLVAEIDGQHHTEVLNWWLDMERQNDIVVHDDKAVLRFAGFALRRHPERVAHVLLTFFTLRSKRAWQLPS